MFFALWDMDIFMYLFVYTRCSWFPFVIDQFVSKVLLYMGVVLAYPLLHVLPLGIFSIYFIHLLPSVICLLGISWCVCVDLIEYIAFVLALGF